MWIMPFLRRLSAPGLLVAAICLLASPALSAAKSRGAEVISINGHSGGRLFEGIGGESAGASTRLLADYPRLERDEILAFLFKPDFGASLQNLKCELGGDINSTEGTEPAYFRSRREFLHPTRADLDRGYETWLMRSARALNPKIRLGLLQWGAPGWLGLRHHPVADYNDRFYSRDNANYIAKAVECLQRFDHIRINFVGCANERMWNVPWVIKLRHALNRDRCGFVHIEMADYFHWNSLVQAIKSNPAFAHSISAIGRHYPNYQSTPAARALHIPLWSGEDWSGAHPHVATMAKLLNRNYIDGRIVRTIIWALEDSYYPNLVCYNDGLLMANQPWCGHFRVPGVIWAVAQTTQFARPGWQYLNSACKILKGHGSIVALKSPGGGNFSIIIETEDATARIPIDLRISGGLPSDIPLHVWRSLPHHYFQRQPNIRPVNAQVHLTLLPHAIYSITTTTGQRKGAARWDPPAAPFPFPWRAKFAHGDLAGVPPYFSDQEGAFDIVTRPKQHQNVLEQMITAPQIPWSNQHRPFTIVGSAKWHNFTASCDIKLPHAGGYAGILSRINQIGWNFRQRNGYRLIIGAAGHWRLLAYRVVKVANKWQLHVATLAHGKVLPLLTHWHHLALSCRGNVITATLDHKVLATAHNAWSSHGMAGLATGWNHAYFRNFAVRPTR